MLRPHMASKEEAARRIFGERAAWYSVSAAHTDPQVLARVCELAELAPADAALDIATGTGHTAFALARHCATVTATDLTPQMLAQAVQLRVQQRLENVHLTAADVHALPFANAMFQRITCRRAAHHFSDIAKALREMRRVLDPHGRLIIDDRSVPEDDFVDRCMNALDYCHDESHVRQYRPSEWLELLDTAGFTVATLETYSRHRPLTALTDGVSPGNARKIHALLDGLTPAQRRALHLTDVDGEPHLNHWYVLIAAVPRNRLAQS
jgi:ubiquinone/menaquinone biosynthesis C-methylase UbiE